MDNHHRLKSFSLARIGQQQQLLIFPAVHCIDRLQLHVQLSAPVAEAEAGECLAWWPHRASAAAIEARPTICQTGKCSSAAASSAVAICSHWPRHTEFIQPSVSFSPLLFSVSGIQCRRIRRRQKVSERV